MPADLDEFVACYNPANRHDLAPTWSAANPEGRWRCYGYYNDLLAAYEQFAAIAADLKA